MQEPIRILIVEDDLLIAQDLQELLYEAGYTAVQKARNPEQAMHFIQSKEIDLALLDIHLSHQVTGIDIAHQINTYLQIPFIYITSYSDPDTIDKIKHTHPSGFLLKPFNKAQLLASIEIGMYNFGAKRNAAELPMKSTLDIAEVTEVVVDRHLLVKENYRFLRIPLSEIAWLESDRNYVTVFTAAKKYIIRSSLRKLLDQLPEEEFIKCHKQYIINTQMVESFTASTVFISEMAIPISRTNQEEVLGKLKQSAAHRNNFPFQRNL